MVEPRWEIKIGSPVIAADVEEYGRLEQLIVDPAQKQVTALIVRRRGLGPSHTVVIPVDMVSNSTEKEVSLQITLDQVDALPEYRPSNPGSNPDSSKVIIRGGQELACVVDQPVGKVSFFLTNPGGRVTGVVGQVGDLPRRNLIVPVDWIANLDPGTLYLSVWEAMLEGLPEYRSDEALEKDAEHALWANETLRNTDYPEMEATVLDGILTLRGHVFSVLNKSRAEEAIKAIPGILGIENHLVVDQELAAKVSGAIAAIDLTPAEHVSVNAHHGFITLTGNVSSAARSEASEVAAASVPQVRGVANTLQAPDVVERPKSQQFWQPRIGEDVYATDILLGHVEQVVIDPNNRCVTAFVTHGFFPDIHQGNEDGISDEASLVERYVVIPTRAILFDGDSALRIMVSGSEAARNRDLSSSGYVYPPEGWQPPYPYDPADVIFEKTSSIKANELVMSPYKSKGIYAR